MREIKFRGYDTKLKKWIYGSLIRYNYGNDCIVVTNEDLETKYFDTIDSDSVGEYTGLKDKNGKEIYEGDIVGSKEYRDKKWVVEYRTDTEYLGFLPKEIGTENISFFISWKVIEVIGNIHENKELLNK